MQKLSPWYGCAVGAVGVVLAALVRAALDPALDQNARFLVFVLPVLAAATIGGLRSGLFTTLLALVVGAVAFVPRAEWGDRDDLAQFGLFLAVGALVSALAERARAFQLLSARQLEVLAEAERYRAIIEEGAAYICRFSVDGALTFVNEAYCRCFGRARDELIGRPFALVVLEEDRERIERLFAALGSGADEYTHEHRVLLPDGSVRWHRWTNRRLRDASGAPAGYHALGIDITERRAAEDALRELTATLEAKVAERTAALAESERRFKAIFHSQFQFIGLMTTGGALVEANRTALAAAGVNESDVLNRPFWETAWWAHDAAQQERLKAAVATAAGGAQDRFEAHHPTADGGLVWVDFSLTPYRDENGSVALLIPEGRDITERKRMEAALRENEERFRMATAVARVGVWEWHIPTGRVKWNDQMFPMYGVPPTPDGAVTYETWRAAVLPDDLPEQLRLLSATVARLGTGNRTFRIRVPGGAVREIEAFETVRAGAGGAAEWMVGTNLDVTDRKRAEERLRAQEALLRQFIKHSPAAIAMLDTEMRYLQASDRWQTDYGLSDRDVIGRSHYEVFPDIPDRWKEIHARVLAGAVERREEDPFHRADGSTVWLEWECRPWYAPDGAVGGLLMFTQVITARKLAEAALRESEERFRSAFDSAAIGMALVSPEGRWLRVNRSVCAMLGYSEAELLATDFQTITHPDDLEADLDLVYHVLAGTIPTYQMEKRYFHKSGRTVQVLLAVSLVRDADGKPLYFVSQLKDVTERRATEDALRASEELYRSVVESLAEGVVVQDAAGAILACNDRACAALGLSRDQMLGRTSMDPRWHTVYEDGAPLPGTDHPNERVLRTGQPVFDATMGVHTPDGELRWLKVNAVPVPRAGDGTGPATVASFHDVTEARALDAQVRASLREKELLLKEIHHRVKNNLQIVSTLLDLQSDFTTDRAALTMFAESRSRVKSMALVHERLYKSHDVARVDFGEYAEQLAGDLFRAYRASDEAVRLVVDVTAPPLPLDVAIPCGLLLNELMSNCFKHAFAGGRTGTLRVALSTDGGAHQLTVADDGPGLPPGYDFRNAASFGLQLVSTLVEQLGGTIDVGGPGATFTVRFRTSPK